MKRLLFCLVLFVVLLISPTKISAQTNNFKCRWDAPQIKCIVSDTVFGSSVDCKEGFAPDKTYCNSFKTGLACEAATGKCLPETDPKTSGVKPGQDPTCNLGTGTGIDTAIGCIPISDPQEFVGFILKWGAGVGGGVAFLLIVYAGFQIMTSSGNPDRLKGGQELMTSAIAGLILIVFSLFILQVIGVDILKIPGFGKP